MSFNLPIFWEKHRTTTTGPSTISVNVHSSSYLPLNKDIIYELMPTYGVIYEAFIAPRNGKYEYKVVVNINEKSLSL